MDALVQLRGVLHSMKLETAAPESFARVMAALRTAIDSQEADDESLSRVAAALENAKLRAESNPELARYVRALMFS
jgi:hypothetical protein